MFRSTVICTTLALMMCVLSPVSGNPLILAPTGTTLTTGQFRAEAALSPDNENGKYYWLGTGLQQYEINLICLDNRGNRDENLVGVQWSFLPETSITPAVSFGVRDVASQSAEGLGVYAAITKHVSVGPAWLVQDFSATVGIGAGGIRGPFLGFEAKLPWNMFAQGEYDSKNVNAAAGWQPTKYLRFKAYTIRNDFYYGAEMTPIAF